MAFTQQSPIGAPNADLITQTLAKLQPDSALQDYARMHKNDIYIVSLANAESNRRKALRLAAQGNPGQQPTVVDQDIAAMSPAPVVAQTRLPENQGIAQLPTPNMQHMADGGIAGFDESTNAPITTQRLDNMGNTGGMFNYAQDGGGVMRMANGGEVKRYAGKGEQLVRTTDGGKTWFLDVPSASRGNPSPAASLANQKFSSRQEAIAAYEALSNTGTAPDYTDMGMGMPTGVGLPAGADVSALKQPAYVPLAATPSAAPAPTPSAAPAPQGTLPTGGASVKQAQDLGDKFFNMKDVKGRIEQQQAQERQDIGNEKEARVSKLEAFNKEQGPAFAGYEKLLKGEEMQDATDKEKAGLMSLMKGFLAMAGGESPNAATNIAKGAMAGLGDYGDALKEFKKSAKERNKAMAEIENARRADAKGDFKTVQDAEDKANDYMRASARHGIDSIISATGKSAEISSGIYKELLQQSGANARNAANLAAPSGVEKLVQRMQTDPTFAAAYKDYASIGPEAKGIAGIAAKMVGNPTAMMLLKQEDPDLHAQVSAYIKQMSLTSTSKPTGQVLVGQ